MNWILLQFLISIPAVLCAQDESYESIILPIVEATTHIPAPNLRETGSMCYNVKPEVCPSVTDPCRCKKLDEKSIVCCHISYSFKLKEGLACANDDSTKIEALHLRNVSVPELDCSAIEFKNLDMLSITEGHIEKLSNQCVSSVMCLNLSMNSISQIQSDALLSLANLKVLDLSRNNLTKLPKISSTNLLLNLSDNHELGCQTVMELLDGQSNITFTDDNSTYCLSSQTFHWFNSTERLPLSQVKVLRNIKQNCTKGCTCAPHRLDMIAGRTPTFSVRVNCSSLGLQSLPEYLPTNTIILHVSNNNITSLDPLSVDKNYQHIREFYADSNQISSIVALEGSKFIDNFLVLSLRENNLKSLPTYILSNTFDRNYHVRHVNLGWNRFHCDCNAAQVVKLWLLANKKHIPDYDQVLCDVTGEKVVELDQNNVCVYQRDWTDYIYYIIAGEILLLLLLVGKVSYDYWVFKTAGYLPWPASKMPKLPCDWVFE